MYKEISKYKTENTQSRSLHCNHSNETLVIIDNEYYGGAGDIINDFINHKTKPFWKRKLNHSEVTKGYINFLNAIKVSQFL